MKCEMDLPDLPAAMGTTKPWEWLASAAGLVPVAWLPPVIFNLRVDRMAEKFPPALLVVKIEAMGFIMIHPPPGDSWVKFMIKNQSVRPRFVNGSTKPLLGC